jgi:tetrapyrrole methylase family protein / MazG family protein
MSDRANDIRQRFSALVEIMQRLRGPDGCPWDHKQSFDTLKTYLLEETYEVLDAVDQRDWPGLAEELGDLLLQPVFIAQIASEEGLFDIGDSLEAINSKLIRRHPHIFGDASAETAEDVKKRWDEIKSQEKAEKGINVQGRSILDDVLRSTPALVEALKLSKKAAAVGFEWPGVNGVLDKIREEAAELVQARDSLGAEQVEAEMGDLLFTVANLARFLHIDPEQALRKANARFRTRFRYVEERVTAAGSRLEDTGLQELENLWQEGKQRLRVE